MIISLPFLPTSVNACFATDFKTKRRFKTESYKQFQKDCLSFMPKLKETCYTKDIEVEINLYMPDKRKRDVDNFCKSLLDTLKIYDIYKDDSQIQRLVVEKYYQKGKPETVIEINQIKQC